MPENKLHKLYNSLNGLEKRALSKWLISPLHCKNEALSRLWSWLLSQNKSSDYVHHAAFAATFPGEKFDGKRWRHTQSQLCQHIEKLLAQRAYEEEPLRADLHLIPVLRQKQLSKSLASVFRRAEHQLASMPQDIDYFHFRYQLEWEKYAARSSSERAGVNNLNELGQALDVYLIASKLRLACMMASHQAVYQIDYDNSFLPAILQQIEGTAYMEMPAIALYYHCYLAITLGTESAFLSLRKELQNHQAGLPLQERRAFLLLAINYCIKQLNTGEQRYVEEALELYQTGLDTKTLLLDGHLSRFAFKNIVALGLRVKKFDWVKSFIEAYTHYLEPSYREAHRQYNLARLFFTQKKYDQAMPMIARIDDRDLLLNLDSKVMLLKMYYERQEWDALDNLLTSFRVQLLRKKKIIGYHQEHYLNMVKYIKKMMRLNPYDKDRIEIFKKEVGANSSVIEKEWLLAQI